MENSGFLSKYSELPDAAKQEVIDFIDFLTSRYTVPKKKRKQKLANEDFIGMWKDRKDLQNSENWVREIRKKEWER